MRRDPGSALAGRRAVITGASSGIGRAVASAFARAGAAVVIGYGRSREAAETLARELRAEGAVAHPLGADVADADAVAGLVADAERLLGGIDTWANVAGADILTGEAAALPDAAKLAALVEVDLRGTVQCCWAAAPAIRAAGGGVILNTSWDQALTGMGERNPEMFAATKAGVTGFTRALARSLAPSIRVNEVAPGWIATAFAERAMAEDYRRRVIEATPLARFGTPEDVARAALFLVSDEAAFITGQTLKVNGGLVS